MITGKDVNDYICSHSVICYNTEKDKLELMISSDDAWKLVLKVMLNISTELNTNFEEALTVASNGESGTLSESNRSSEEDA